MFVSGQIINYEPNEPGKIKYDLPSPPGYWHSWQCALKLEDGDWLFVFSSTKEGARNMIEEEYENRFGAG